MLYYSRKSQSWLLVYSGDGGDAGDGGGTTEGGVTGAAGTGDAGDAGNSGGTGDAGNAGTGDSKGGDKTFTQEQLNTILAKEKRASQDQLQKALQEIDNTKKRSNLNEKERKELESRIEDLQNSMLSKEQLTEKEKEKESKKIAEQIKELTTDRDAWQTRYTRETINRAITDAAVEHEAHTPSQIVALLSANARLAEDIDAEGTPNGKLIPKIKFEDIDKENKPVTLDLTVSETLKRMTEMSQHANLFKNLATGGLGDTTQPGGGKVDETKLSPAAYRERRKKKQLLHQKE